jgi:hypothetical protein
VLLAVTTDTQRDEVVEVELGTAVLEPYDVMNLQAFGRSAVHAAVAVTLLRRCSRLLPVSSTNTSAGIRSGSAGSSGTS